MTKNCPECGEEQEDFAKFCKNCGASLSSDDSTRCSNCGCEINNEAYCPDCGQPTGITICPKCGQKTVNEDYCTSCGYKINKNVKRCRNCGSKIDVNSSICANCGANVEDKNAIVAFVLSLIFPGLGQLYNGQNHKGVVLIFGYIVSWILSLILIGIVIALLIWLFGMYDAFTSANAINRGENLEDRIF